MAGGNCRTCVVYGLASSEDGVIRYIGQTSRGLGERLCCHKQEAKTTRSRKAAWIKSVHRSGHSVIIKSLVRNAVWNETERNLIALYRRRGFRLVNGTDGGQGVPGMSPETRARIAKGNRGKRLTAEQRKKVSEAGRRRMANPDERKRIAHLTRVAMARPEVKAKLGLSPWNDARREGAARRLRQRYASPEARAQQARRVGKLTDDQVREARRLRSEGASLDELCALYGLTHCPMSLLCRGLTYRHVA